MNGLSSASAPAVDEESRSAAADAAFARMVAAHPGATVVGGEPRTVVEAEGNDSLAAAVAAFAHMVAAHPDAVEVAPGVFATSRSATD